MNPQDFTLLIVDDEETMRRSMAELLKLEGYQTATAKDGTDAINQIKERSENYPDEPFDLILLDLKMPVIDGLEVLRFMNTRSPDTLVILLTAHGSLQSAIEALQRGAHDYILKPALPEKIIQSVREGLRKRSEHLLRTALVHQLEASVHALRNFPYREQREPETDWNLQQQNEEYAPKHVSGEYKILPITKDISLDIDRREITFGKNTTTLTPYEAKLLTVLIWKKGYVITHQELVQQIQGYEVSSIDAQRITRPLVSRLRHKLAQYPNGDTWITTIRATGYVFTG